MSTARRLAIALALATAACGSGRLEPVPVPLDRVSCASCGMLISDRRTAAEAVFAGEDPRFYDDIGCAASDRALPRAKTQVYVPSENETGWLRAETAYFARVPNLRTPMGYGLAAFDSRSRAEARDRDGRARTWNEIRSELSRRGDR